MLRPRCRDLFSAAAKGREYLNLKKVNRNLNQRFLNFYAKNQEVKFAQFFGTKIENVSLLYKVSLSGKVASRVDFPGA